MRLLLFSQQLRAFTSGLGTYAHGLAAGMARRGHGVTVAVPRTQVGELPGVRVISLELDPGNPTPVRAARVARAYRAVLRAEASAHDVVHFLDARDAGLLPTGSRAMGSLGSVHDSYALDWRAVGHARELYADRRARGVYYAWLRWLERRAYRELEALVANSRHVASALTAGYDVGGERIAVVPIGLASAPAASPERLVGDPAILFVGGNFQRKGLFVLLEAIARLRDGHPAMRLHVVGGDPDPGRVARCAAALGVGRCVVIHGWQPHDRVRAMMAGASVFAMPSLVEAFGLVYLEAMSAGVPVLASGHGGMTEILRHGVDALLVPPGDVGSLVEALERVLADEALRRRLIAAGRETAAGYTMEKTVAATLAVYERVAR